jgi:hypothetical protein
MHLRYLRARHPEVAGGSVHHVQAVSSRVTPSPPSRRRDAKGPLPAGPACVLLAASQCLTASRDALLVRCISTTRATTPESPAARARRHDLPLDAPGHEIRNPVWPCAITRKGHSQCPRAEPLPAEYVISYIQIGPF